MKRSHELDSLRGVAAFAVLLSHAWLMLPERDHALSTLTGIAVKASPLRLLFAGHAAVTLFFVLSGYVLTASLDRPVPLGYGAFLVRRFCRIMIPYSAIVLVAAGLFVGLPGTNNLHAVGWLTATTWREPLTLRLLLDHLLMSGTQAGDSLDPPMWSLVVEMRASVLFPFLLILTKWKPRYAILSTLALYVIGSVAMSRADQMQPQSMFASLAFLAEFMPFFLAGVLLYRHRSQVAIWYGCLMPTRQLLLFVVCAFVFCLPNFGPLVQLSVPVKALWTVALIASSCGFIIIATCAVPARRVLGWAPLRWLGSVSYSLYLTHLLVFVTMIDLLLPTVPLSIILVLSVVASLPTAWLRHAILEVPAQAIGHRLSKARGSRNARTSVIA